MDMLKVGLAAIAVCFMVLSLQPQNESFRLLLIGAGGIFFLFCAYDSLVMVVTFLRDMSSRLSISSEYFEILLKLLGIAYISEFSAGVCKDAGCTTLAMQVELVGKLFLMVTSLPLIEMVVSTISQIMGG